MVIGIWNKDAEWSGGRDFSNFGSLKSTEIERVDVCEERPADFSNFGSLKSTEIRALRRARSDCRSISAISAR